MKHYDKIANTYDQQYQKEQDEKITAALESLNQMENAFIIDVGCGTGLLFKHVLNKAKLIIGMDVSAKLLKQAREKAKNFANVMLIRADIDLTPFPSNTFTHAFAFTLLQNMPNPNTTLKEIKRITHPNAIIVITGLKKQFSHKTFMRLLKNAQLEILSLKADEKLKDFVAVCRKRG